MSPCRACENWKSVNKQRTIKVKCNPAKMLTSSQENLGCLLTIRIENWKLTDSAIVIGIIDIEI